MVERSQDETVVCLGWLKGRCGCVEILGGEDGPFEYEWHWRLWDEISCRSHVMGSNKCRGECRMATPRWRNGKFHRVRSRENAK